MTALSMNFYDECVYDMFVCVCAKVARLGDIDKITSLVAKRQRSHNMITSERIQRDDGMCRSNPSSMAIMDCRLWPSICVALEREYVHLIG